MRRLAAALVLAAPALPVAAQQAAAPATPPQAARPLLEAGVFLGAGLLPAYPAAGRSEPRPLVLPWLIYHGEFLQSTERGLRGRIYRLADLELTLNANGALGSRAGSGGIRSGMADLDPMGEIGPSLRWVAWRDAALSRIVVETPLRAAFTTDFSRIRYRGFLFAPEVAFERTALGAPGARARIGIGPVFASGGLMDYWYRVKPAEARPGRAAYDAGGGYLGLRLQFSYRLPVTDRIWLTAGGRIENFSGAANAASPLFRSDVNATLVAGMTFSFYRSAAMVASDAAPFD